MSAPTIKDDPTYRARAMRLLEKRSDRGWSQMTLAHRAGLAAGATISQLETCRVRGTIDTWADLAAALDVSPGWLVYGEGSS